jgi:hypothetical protein
MRRPIVDYLGEGDTLDGDVAIVRFWTPRSAAELFATAKDRRVRTPALILAHLTHDAGVPHSSQRSNADRWVLSTRHCKQCRALLTTRSVGHCSRLLAYRLTPYSIRLIPCCLLLTVTDAAACSIVLGLYGSTTPSCSLEGLILAPRRHCLRPCRRSLA